MRLTRFALALLVASVSSLHAQHVVTHAKPIHLRHLTGTIVDTTGFPVEYAMVELRNADDHSAIASTFADAKGKFFFADRKRRQHFEIRASHAGFNIAQYSLVITRFGQSHMRIILPIAT